MPEIEKRVVRAIEEKVFPGCVIGILKNKKKTVLPFGTIAYGKDRVRKNTVYDLASVTKSIPTASLAISYLADTNLKLDDPVITYVPELKNDHGATIEDLLRYRVQGPALSKIRVATFEEVRTRALEHGFEGPPSDSHYSNLPAYILGILLERISKGTIAELAHKQLFEPLQMHDTTFFPSISFCAPTEIDARGVVRGLPHDESAYLFAKERRSAGHAGLFSTASDLLKFMQALLYDSDYADIREGAEWGLGWQVNEQYFMGSHAGAKTFGKTGFTGTSVLCDYERKIALVILSNRTYPKRPADAFWPNSAINVFRRDIADIVLSVH